jgi:opacity protein-like surface antigen
MKQKLTFSIALLALGSYAAHAGDSKDMKDMKQMSQAESSDAGFYVAVEGGADFSNYYGDRRSVGSVGGANFNVTPQNIHTDPRAVGGIRGGYAFNSWAACDGLRLQPAVELEGMYIGSQSSYDTSAFGVAVHNSTSYNNAVGMLNGILRFKIENSPVVPYIGLGAGAEYITSHTDFTTPVGVHVTGATGSDVDFAAQALAGIDFKITDHWSLFGEYKFIDALGTDLHSPSLGTPAVSVDYRFKPDQFAQMVGVAGVKYSF